jgi:MtrB/PioB family decaheme-associated outer membrane protein
VRADVNEVKRKGINVLAGPNGTSPGNGFMDLPAPIDYTARNYSAEAGYSGGRAHVAASFLYSQFENNNDALRWSNGFFGNGLDTTVLPPDNELTRFGLNGNIRRLAFDSTLAARFTHNRLTNNVALQPTMLTGPGAVFSATNPNEPNFRGNVEKTTFSASLASRPLSALETRLYYDYQKEENHSTELVFTPAAGNNLQCSGGPCTPELYHYKKSAYGAEAGYRVTRANKLSTGLEYAHVERERVDFPKTNERKWFLEWKNSSLDALSARLKYQRLTRHSSFDDTQAAAFLVNPMDLYVRRFDLANVEQNLYKLVLDASPVNRLDLGLEAIVKRNNYPDTLLGRRSDSRQEYYASIAYGDPSSFRVLVFGDIELVKFESVHRVGTGNPDPNSGSNATTYNWNSTIHDRSWQTGIGADWKPHGKLTLKSSAIYAETKGEVDFMIAQGGPGTLFPRIPNFHNSRRTTFSLRAIYDYTKEWELTAGYAYERYAFSDISYDDTLYVTAATTSAGYVTGQYSFQPYSANIVYGIVKYRF